MTSEGAGAEERDKTRLPEKDEPDNAGYDLSLLIQNLVIPKLIADRQEPGYRLYEQELTAENSAGPANAITAEDVEKFSLLSTTSDARELLDFVDKCLANGSSVDSIYVDLLAPTARRLGEYWESDERDFVDVTMGLWRIQEILRELTLRIPPPALAGFGQRSALFSTMPGEQHSFGTLMIAECFYRAGWDADIMIEPSQSELIGKFAGRHYDLIGLTVSLDYPKATLSGLVNAIRSVSSNPETRIMMGGRVINNDPGLIEECGADATAADAPSAVKLADDLVPLKANIFESLV
ncbi:MAG: cobalamin B12-binding protein [Sphingomonadales bacterium]|nr:cobalamin B12-binding protein [Sphingomonadales bacterium]PIX64477.1 MAG: cobalamin B12-binding protein [Sphingomonadales bacterium CG_4_10_14_3_um_filter_58_15]NCO48846.1 cobalamin B12-binding protein [Sphingomonadales bacterium]NCO99395.1 cobalamin B12-binding protein [Sphingomonadales bacterium]NCP27020.1 cobalamin B12-binding protein [Sphingomonadales bacterium]